MRGGMRGLALAMAAALCLCGARADTTSSEYLVNLSAEEVRQLEARLNALGFLSSAADGAYDAETRQAIETFQQANGLDVTGQLDDTTRQRLASEAAISRAEYLRRFAQGYHNMTPLKNGDVSASVQAMQMRLAELGYFFSACDGAFTNATQAAVERFQMVNGLRVTGEADGMTLMRLMAGTPLSWEGFISEMCASPGDVGLNVYVLQRKLRQMGFFTGECTANYGELTQKAVAQFQESNELDATGIADRATWQAIYSGSAITRRRADVLQLDDQSETVASVQRRLSELGFYSQEATGRYDYLTETAVRLFQMAVGLPASGNADGETLGRLMADSAPMLSDPAVQARYIQLLSARRENIQQIIAEIAEQMIGVAFLAPEEALYPGFALTQYVCVAAGMPITQPETLMRLTDDSVTAASEVRAGNIVALQTEDDDTVSMLLTIGAGDGRVIYATRQTGYVVMSYIEQLNAGAVYRWSEGVT